MKQVKFITGLMAFGVVSLFAGCGEKENEMTKVTLNEVAHSIFYEIGRASCRERV